jgi:hypothetical protein
LEGETILEYGGLPPPCDFRVAQERSPKQLRISDSPQLRAATRQQVAAHQAQCDNEPSHGDFA